MSSKSQELLIELVKHDRECRGVGIAETYQITDDYPLGRETVRFNFDDDDSSSDEDGCEDKTKHLYQGMPCLSALNSYQLDDSKTASDVLNLLFDKCATLKTIGPEHFLSGKLCIAGGAVVWALSQNNPLHKLKDCDLFFTGVTSAEASAIVEDIIKKTAINNPYCVFSRNQHALNIDNPNDGVQVQIMFRLYNTVSEVIHSFDLPSCAAAYSKDSIHFTRLSRYCIVNAINVIDTTRRSRTYEFRLVKYFWKGFSIVFPELDVSKFTCGKTYTFGDMTVIFGKQPRATTRQGAKSDYFNSSIHLSLIKIRNGYLPDLPPEYIKPKRHVHGYSIEMTADELATAASLMEGTITDQIRKTYISHARHSASKDLIALRKRNENLFTVTEEEYETIIAENKLKPTDFVDINKAIVDYVMNQIETHLDKMVTESKALPIYWERDGSQLVQYNPIREHPQKWYGEVYHPVFESRTDTLKTKIAELAAKYKISDEDALALFQAIPLPHTY